MAVSEASLVATCECGSRDECLCVCRRDCSHGQCNAQDLQTIHRHRRDISGKAMAGTQQFGQKLILRGLQQQLWDHLSPNEQDAASITDEGCRQGMRVWHQA